MWRGVIVGDVCLPNLMDTPHLVPRSVSVFNYFQSIVIDGKWKNSSVGQGCPDIILLKAFEIKLPVKLLHQGVALAVQGSVSPSSSEYQNFLYSLILGFGSTYI